MEADGLLSGAIGEGEMKKPVEAIERMREWVESNRGVKFYSNDGQAILAYIDSLKPWPADLTRERLMELAIGMGFESRSDALRRLAELAPVRETQRVELWEHEDGMKTWARIGVICAAGGWRKVGGPFEVDA
jgi:hypothetical protein